MTLASGTRLGPYEIVVAIGAGGMGEVYKARDTRLDRIVAIKVLPGAFVPIRSSVNGSTGKPARSRSWIIRTSARCTTSVNRTARRSSSCSTSKGRR